MMLEIDAITKMLAAVSTGRDTRPRSRLKATSRLGRAHPKSERRDDHGDADSNGLVQRFEYQVAREAGAKERREHAERETVELDVVLDGSNRQRTEQQQGEDDDGSGVIHATRELVSRIDRLQPVKNEAAGPVIRTRRVWRIAARLVR